MKSHMLHNFQSMPSVQKERATFREPFEHKTTFDVGYLIPIYVHEVLPGDTTQVNMTCFSRLSSALKWPIMDNLWLETAFFEVPNRLVWEHWKQFCGEKLDPDDTTEFAVPQVMSPANGATPIAVGTLADYFGLPLVATGLNNADLPINAMPFRAYNLIYSEWFRDQNLIDHPYLQRGDGPDQMDYYVVQKVAKLHDYFTSCTPWAQKGDPVQISLGDTAPVLGDGYAMGLGDSVHNCVMEQELTALTLRIATDVAEGTDVSGQPMGDQFKAISLTGDPGHSHVYADLSSATASTINALRLAFQKQRFLELDARSGTRYTEKLRAHFGVMSPDMRQQRPEYIGGSKTRININTVQKTAEGSGDTKKLGDLAAFATNAHNGHWIKSSTEHGFIIGLAWVRADLTYQQGINRMWSRQSVYDYYWPAFAHIGEQPVYLKELYCVGDPDDQHDMKVFGYQEAWAEYRHKPSLITGKFRSAYSTPLDAWHLSEEFQNAPVLGKTFIEDNTPMSRVLAVTTEHHIIADFYFDQKATRVMPLFSVPGLIDHF